MSDLERRNDFRARIAELEAERDKLKAELAGVRAGAVAMVEEWRTELEKERALKRREMVDMTTDRDRWQTAYNDVSDQLRAYKCAE